MMGQDMESEIKRNNGLPLVSIITPSYNQGEFIEETIDSVLNQTYPNIEYIIVDGGSTDNTLEILKKYENRIQWISEKDKGQANAINKGILRTKGELIGWINSDDVYERDGIEKLVACWKKHPEADLIYGEGIYIDREGRKVGRYLTEVFTKEKLGKQCIICQPSTLFSRVVIERVGMLNEQYQMGMDYELWLRISNRGNIVYMPEYIARSRMYQDNKTMSRRDEAYREACNAVKENYGYVSEKWTSGYAFYLSGEKKNLFFYKSAVSLFFKYNHDNKNYIIREIWKWLKKGKND